MSGFSRTLYSSRVPVHLVDHDLAHDALVELRSKDTPPDRFRLAATRISLVLAAEAMRDMPGTDVSVETPLAPAPGRRVDDLVVVAVLRAGLGMLDAVLQLAPRARVGLIGLRRDEATAVASQYYANVPANIGSSVAVLVDPMLATGGSAVAALDILKRAGATNIRFICLVAAPEGVAHVERHHPDVAIYVPVVDHHLNARKYIVPGLGDFGDRLYGTL